MNTQNRKIQTPFAPALWPTLLEPQLYSAPGITPKAGDKGRYSVTLQFDPDNSDHKEFLEVLEALGDDLIKEIKEKEPRAKINDPLIPCEPDMDKEGNETGLMNVKFARNAGGISERSGKAWTARIGLYDRKGQKYVHDDSQGEMANGTRLRVEAEVNQYKMSGRHGVSLRLTAAQISEVQYYGEGQSSFAGVEVAPEEFEEGAADLDTGGDF